MQPVILIPSLEPDERLPAYVGALLSSGFDRVVVVDDGSPAKSQPIFAQLEALPGCTVLHHEVNRGKGAALRTGYAWIADHCTDAPGVITADADGQHTVADCHKLADALLNGENALYLGSRDFSLPNVPPKSRFGNRCTSVVFRLLHGKWLPDTQTGLRAFRFSELQRMLAVTGDRYEYEMNVLIACAHEGLPMVPITIETVYENGNEGTHFHPIRDSWRIYKVILGSFFRFMGSSLICVVIDQVLAGLLRGWLPALGLAQGTLANINVSGFGARLVSAVVNFLLNKNLVFSLKGSAGKQAIRYAVLCVGIILVSNAGVWLLGQLGMAHWLAKLICDTLLYFVSYRVQSRWVFAGEEKKA